MLKYRRTGATGQSIAKRLREHRTLAVLLGTHSVLVVFLWVADGFASRASPQAEVDLLLGVMEYVDFACGHLAYPLLWYIEYDTGFDVPDDKLFYLFYFLVVGNTQWLALVFVLRWLLPVRQECFCCRKCGYDLRGSSESGRCPECGQPMSEIMTEEGARMEPKLGGAASED